MQELGFKEVKALYLPTNFQQDWIAKGFPIEKGEAMTRVSGWYRQPFDFPGNKIGDLRVRTMGC